MMKDIFSKFNIDSYAFLPSSSLRPANVRLFSQLPENTTVIFMLFPYFSGDCEGRISAYSAVFDYHSFAREVFASLESFVSAHFPDRYAKGFCDHSPFLESEGAARAGLGVLGDNSLLICEKYSSYVFIGELVTTLTREELLSLGIPEGAGVISECIHCSACKAACPAKVASPHTREGCASDISQKKGELSDSEAALLSKVGSAWGCDICQKVCPYTKAAAERGTLYSPIPFFRDSYISGDPLSIIPKMDGETFCRYPFAWRKRAPVERNIEIINKKGKKL